MIGFNLTTLISVYIFICIALIVYHIVYAIYDLSILRHQRYAVARYEKQLRWQLDLLALEGKLNDSYSHMIERNLKKFHLLQVFHDACAKLKKEESFPLYLDQMIPLFQQLAVYYQKHDDMEKAYFAWMIADLYSGSDVKSARLARMLLPYIINTSIYCRENTLSALYQLGDSKGIEKAFSLLDEQKEFHHGKLISDGLLKFQGDHEELAALLWKHYGTWKNELMAAIVDYIRFVSPAYGMRFLPVLQDPKSDLEVRLAILRYYRKVAEPAALDTILACAKGKYESECQIVSCMTLAAYPGAESIAVLKNALSSNNWYVRKNAAASYLHMAQPADLQEILTGQDRYARDMVRYMIQEQEECK